MGNTNFETQTKPIWRYDGPSGPGWGVRNFTALDWYADLTPTFVSSFCDTVGDSIHTFIEIRIDNLGSVSLDSVSVRFYEGAVLTSESFESIPADSFSMVTFQLSNISDTLYVKIDEDNLKIELSDSNNIAITAVSDIVSDIDSDGVAD